MVLNWPVGVLAARTFTATLDDVSLDLSIDVTDTTMTIIVTAAQTGAVASGTALPFVLTETTSDDQPILTGSWRASDRPNAVSTETIELTLGASIVNIGMVDALGATVNDLVVAGQATFVNSPIVPNPAALGVGAAASIDEVQDLIAESSAGFIRSLDPKGALTNVSNTTTETTLLNGLFSMPKLTHETVVRLVAGGVCRCTAGGPITFTWRLRNNTDTLVLAAPALALATDTQGNRVWRLEVAVEGNTGLADSALAISHLIVGAGDSAALQQSMHQAAVDDGTDPQNWDLTVQMSAANSGALVSIYTAQLFYAIPGA